MKPIFVILLLVIVLTSSAFVMVYNYWKDIEANPILFAAGLIGIVMSGAIGMLYMIISRPALQPVRVDK